MSDLFDFGAERLAIQTGLPASQARLRIQGLDAAPSGPLFDAVSDATAPVARRRFRFVAIHDGARPFSGHPMRHAMNLHDAKRGPWHLAVAPFVRTVLVVEGPLAPDPDECPHNDFVNTGLPNQDECADCGKSLDAIQRDCHHMGAAPQFTSAGETCGDCGAILSETPCFSCGIALADAASVDCHNDTHAGDCYDCGARCSAGGSCPKCDAADFA